MTKNTLLSVGFMAATTVAAQSQTIADWDFSGVSGLTPDGPAIGTLIGSAQNAVPNNVISSDLVGLGALAYEDFNGAAGELNLRNFSGAVGSPDLNNNTGVMDFTLTAVAGQTLFIEEVVISAYRNGGGAAAVWRYQVNVDGAGFINFGPSVNATAGGGPSFKTETFNGADISGANSVVFRFTAINGAGNIHFNDIKVKGSVTPEPSSTALIGLGGLALILRRRK